jgi:hypothetical protein
MTKIKAFNGTRASSKIGEMNEYGVIMFQDGSISHLSKESDVIVFNEPVTLVRSEPELIPEKKNNKRKSK